MLGWLMRSSSTLGFSCVVVPRTEEAILDALVGKDCHSDTRSDMQKLLRDRQLEDREIKVDEHHRERRLYNGGNRGDHCW